MQHDVIIAGAGPAGLFLACELEMRGVTVLVLERDTVAAPIKEAPFGVRGLTVPTVEALSRRGLLADIAVAQPPGRGHFAGIAIDETLVTTAMPDLAVRPMATTMARLETVLTSRAAALGVVIRRGITVDGVVQTSDGVAVQAGDAVFHGRWLVGCDGGRSAVRKAAGMAMTGTPPRFTGYSVDAELADPAVLPLGRHMTPAGMFIQSQPGVIAMADFDGGAFHRSGPVTREHVQAVLRRISGTSVTLAGLRLAATWTDRTMQATTWRQGRVLLAGDAVHLHAPLGGQGLNLGVGDAMNLGWKLAATVHGTAPAGLLDSYQAEREPVAAQVLDWSRAQVALLQPDEASRALAAIVRDLIGTGDGATYFAHRMRGLAARYDLGGTHPLTGRRAPKITLEGETGARLLESGSGILVNGAGDPAVRTLGRQGRPGLHYEECAAVDYPGLSAMLVRPDGIVAWACDQQSDAGMGATGLEHALQRWFGDRAV